MVAAAIVGAAVVGAVATNVASNRASGDIQSGTTAGINAIQSSTDQGVKALTGAQDKGVGAINTAYSGIGKSFSPFEKLGTASADKLKQLLTGSPASMMKTLESLPGYQFQLQQGDQGTINAATATGMNLSGNTLEALSRYNQGLAGTYEGQYAGQLAGAAGLGESATVSAAQAKEQQGGQLAGLYENTGTNLASLYAGEGSSVAGLIGGNAQSQAGIASARASSEAGIAQNASNDYLLMNMMQSDFYNSDITRWN
jgi:hypothetical protein